MVSVEALAHLGSGGGIINATDNNCQFVPIAADRVLAEGLREARDFASPS